MITKLIEKINKYNSIIIFRHKRPDLDAVGSQIGLALTLKNAYPEKEIFIVGEMTNELNFLGKMDEIEDNKFHNSLAIILDVAVKSLVSDERYKLSKEVFIIDHHTNSSDISTAKTIIDSSYIACAEIVAEILFNNNFFMPKEAATALFAGIVSDSGRFQYKNTSARTFSITAKLLENDADMQFIYENIYVTTLESKKIENYFSQKFEVSTSGVGYMFNKEDVFEKFSIDFFTVSRKMISVMAGIEEVKIWCNFTIDLENNVIACEFRSRNIPIVEIARKYGGGGHNLACGSSVASWDIVNKILADFEELAKNYN